MKSPTLCNPIDCIVHDILHTGVGSFSVGRSPGDRPNPRIKPRSPALQVDSLPVEPQGKPKNTGVGSLILSPVDLHTRGIEQGSPVL